MSDMISKTKFQKHIKQVVVPQGFVASMETEQLGYSKNTMLVFVLKSDTIELRFDQSGSGHTLFTHDGGRRSFDRRGVDDSFYHLPLWGGDDEKYDLNAIVAEQIERVQKAIEQIKVSIPVPGIPFSVTPERLVELKKMLKRNGSITFTPSGFGTGYIITHGTKHRSGTKRAGAELEKLFEETSLYISTFDAD